MMGTSQNSTMFADSTTYLVSRIYTLREDVSSTNPQTNTISKAHTNGSQNHCRLTP